MKRIREWLCNEEPFLLAMISLAVILMVILGMVVGAVEFLMMFGIGIVFGAVACGFLYVSYRIIKYLQENHCK